MKCKIHELGEYKQESVEADTCDGLCSKIDLAVSGMLDKRANPPLVVVVTVGAQEYPFGVAEETSLRATRIREAAKWVADQPAAAVVVD
jgi:hypothetical protein